VSELQGEYGDVAEFVHVEVWHDFQAGEVNEAAADWLLTPDGDLTEPWVFLIGEDGRILARWDNVATRQEIEPWLKRL
jgi:peroxiredoxin